MAQGEQNEPIQGGSHDASVDEKKQGILVQVAADTDGRSEGEVMVVLAERLEASGILVDQSELHRLAQSLPNVDWDRSKPDMA